MLMGTSLAQTFTEESINYRFVLLGEAVTYLLVGLLFRRRYMVVSAGSFLVLGGALFGLEAQRDYETPPWAILALVGVALLALGFLFMLRRDWLQDSQKLAVGWWNGWAPVDRDLRS